MGRGAAPTPSALSRAVLNYVRHLVLMDGGDLGGRSMARTLSKSATYYRDRLAGTKLYDTNDIGEIATHFETTPQAFIRAAIAYQQGAEATQEKPISLSDEYRLAAKRNVIDAEEDYEGGA